MKLQVQRREWLADAVIGLWLESVDGALPGFSAGAHIDLKLAENLVRPYSLCNPSEAPETYQLAVLLDPNSTGGSIAVSKLQPGDQLECSEPKNHFELVDGSRYRLFAAGIGITPIWAMAQQLRRQGAKFTLNYRARSPEAMAFRAELEVAPFADAVALSYSSQAGFDMAALVAAPGADEQLYVCGPQRFIDPLLEQARAAGWRENQLHREYFSADPSPSSEQNRAFRVRVAATGEEYEVGPDQSIAEVLEAAGHFVPVSCQEGVCGTCMVPVLEGVPDHRDLYMTPDEHADNDMITACCSRAKSDLLVLDI